jgi:hypothetical protein
MNEIETLNNQKNPSWPFSKEWTKAWKQLEEQVRERPGPHLLMAFAIGYFLQIIPFENLLVLAVRLARPVLFLAFVFQLAKHISKGSNSGANLTDI